MYDSHYISADSIALEPCYSKCGPRTSTISITWGLVRKAESHPDLLTQNQRLNKFLCPVRLEGHVEVGVMTVSLTHNTRKYKMRQMLRRANCQYPWTSAVPAPSEACMPPPSPNPGGHVGQDTCTGSSLQHRFKQGTKKNQQTIYMWLTGSC